MSHHTTASHAAQTFADRVRAIPGGEHLELCYSCGTCVSKCLIQQKAEPLFNPRRLLRLVMMEMEAEAFADPTTWLCSACDLCYPACPQQIHISGVIGAVKQLAVQAGYTSPLKPAQVDEAACFACGTCIEVCPYQAVERVSGEVVVPDPMAKGRTFTIVKEYARVDPNLCMGCGLCASSCLASCITLEDYTDTQIDAQARAPDWRPGWPLLDDGSPVSTGSTCLLVLVCNWSIRADADTAILDEPPPGVQVVRVPCSGRITPTFLVTALQKGADGVLVIGCQPGECHYQQGNLVEQARLTLTRNFLDLLGLEAQRIQFAWMPTQSRGELSRLLEQMQADLAQLAPLDWRPELG